MIQVGQTYQATKGNALIYVSKDLKAIGPKTFLMERVHALDTPPIPEDKKFFYLWEKDFQAEIVAGRWIMVHDINTPLPEFEGKQNRLEAIE